MTAAVAVPLAADFPAGDLKGSPPHQHTHTAPTALLHVVTQLLGPLTPGLLRRSLPPADRGPAEPPPLADFLLSGWVALLLLALRYTAERTLLPPLTRFLDRARARGDGKAAAAAAATGSSAAAAIAVLDSAWIATVSAALAALAWAVTLADNGGCTPWHTAACFAGWPHHPVSALQRGYLMLAWGQYAGELAGLAVGVGTRLKAEMVAHHAVAMALMMLSYPLTLQRMSIMWQALFDLSNPILHAAKALHASGLRPLQGRLKWALFNLFAATFLICRVIGGPLVILWPSFTTAREVLPPAYCYGCWGLQVFVCGLQVMWFYRIVEIAVRGEKGAAKAA